MMHFAPVYPILYRLLKPAFPNCLWSGAANQRTVALTFDDGPHPEYTPRLLKVLERYQVRANFFWLGRCVHRYPTLAREVCQQGHWIGLHGYTHQSFPLLKPEELKQSLLKTRSAIAETCQLDPAHLLDVRPPNGLFTPDTLKQLHSDRYRVVMWSVVPEDWVRPGIPVVTQRVRNQVHNGALIVLHDGDYGGQDVAQTCTDLIPWLLEQNYRCITIDEMWQQLPSSNLQFSPEAK